MNKFYVYALFRPNGIVCYIGKGSGKRWQRHEELGTNPHLAAIIKKAGGSIPRIKVRENLLEDAAFEIERALIKAVGREANGGPLVNLTDGGDGVSGLKHSAETRRTVGKLSANMWRDPRKRDEIIAAQNAARATAEYRENRKRISQRIMTEEVRARISATKKKQYETTDLRDKISAATRAVVSNPDTRARTKAAQIKRHKDPVEREKLAEAGRRGAAVRWHQPPVKGL